MAKTIDNKRDWRAHWNAVSEWAEPGEFAKQVKRTICGRPMGDEQITISAEVARSALNLDQSDVLLDLCCGNGLVTVRLAETCRFVYGVDYASDLIELARRHYAAANIRYIHCDAAELTVAQLDGVRPSKIAMIAGLQYFTVANLERLLATIARLTGGAAPMFFSDIPDVDHLYDFYDTPERRAWHAQQEKIGTEPMGTWWSRTDLEQIFHSSGYTADFRDQEPHRYAAYYHRFDLLVQPTR